MKNVILIFIAFLLVSCGSNSSKSDYSQAIGDYLQTDKRGTKYDLNFKAIEMTEQGKITVADSITTLTEKFRGDKKIIIDRIELAKKMSKDLLERENNRRSPDQKSIDKYNADIMTIDQRIDSLKNLSPDNLNGYKNRNSSDVLAIIIRCKYSLTAPGKPTAERTDDFILSPDGKRCYSVKSIK